MGDAEEDAGDPAHQLEPVNSTDTGEAEPVTAEEAPKPAAKKVKVKAEATPAAGVTAGRAKRERKQVEVYTAAAPKEVAFVIKPGTGSKLRDIPNVAFKLSKITGRDELVEHLHLLLYRRKGTLASRKKDVLEFSGFAFEEAAMAKELEARKASLSKWKLEVIHRLLDTLDVPRGSGGKAEKVDKVLEFLAGPAQLSDVDLAAKEAAKKVKRSRAAAKKEAAMGKEEKAKPKAQASGSKKKPTAKKANKEEAEGEESEAEAQEEDEVEAESEEESEEVYVPKSTRKRAKPSGGKPSAEEPAGEPMECEEAPVGEEEGKVKDPAAGIPAEELKADVEAVLGVIPQEELGSVSAKSLLEALADKHGFSFKSRKAEVKQWAQEFVLAKMEGAGGAAEGEAAEGAAVDETAQPEADGEQATGEAEGGGDEGGEAAAEEGEDSRESGQWLTD